MKEELAISSMPTAAEHQALVALSFVDGIGPERIRALIAEFGSAEAVLNAAPKALTRVSGIGAQTVAALTKFADFDRVKAQFRKAEQIGASLQIAWEAGFPGALRQIYNPPVFLWMRGAFTPADARAFAIVGTRRATDYGKRIAHEFATELAQRGWTIVSGLAYGIDTAAHRGAVEAGGRTIAVLGSGVDRIYPAKNTSLAQQIMQQGAVISEYALGTAPDAPNFPRRNRIISGLAQGVLVVEAAERGGALITAHMALEQNREVFAIPGSLFRPMSAGTNALIRHGHAKLVQSVDDILIELGMEDMPAESEEKPDLVPPDLNRVEQTLYEALTTEPCHIDVLCQKTGLDASSALVYLLNLEFKGLVRQMAGKQFFRVR